MAKQTITIANEVVTMETIQFEDIKAGDTIAHMATGGESVLIGQGLQSSVWIGVVESFSEVGHAWYGNGRKQATLGYTGGWSDYAVDSREDVLVVAQWHGTEDGHSIWKVIS